MKSFSYSSPPNIFVKFDGYSKTLYIQRFHLPDKVYMNHQNQ